MKRLLVLLVITVLMKSTFATLQSPDHVIIKNEIYFSYSDLFKHNTQRDSIFKNASKQIQELEMNANPDVNEYEVRPIYGIWEIIENKIFLHKLTDGVHEIDLHKIFPEKEPNKKVFANWLTDTLYISKGNVLVHGSIPVRKYEIAFLLDNGEVVSRIDYTNQILKISDFNVDNKFLYQHINWKSIPDLNEKVILVHVEIMPAENGIIDFIDNVFAIIDKEVITGIENPYIEEAIRIARLVPDWNVVIQRDKIIPQLMTIYFDQRLKKKYAR